MFSNQDVVRVRAELRRPIVEEEPMPAFAQVDMFQRWREDAPVAAQGVKRKREDDECPPLPKRQLATTTWERPCSPLVPQRSVSVNWEVPPPPPTPRRASLNWSNEPYPVPITRQNAVVREPPPSPSFPVMDVE